ncbi:MAG: prepilin-type N-terminal cleavage/methylation domain-containing protein [Pseudomonadales bacterium]|nr:prepilin-type N-terminal cleavage/methylation domain-containing protein [Pseudomonadales bacterium]
MECYKQRSGQSGFTIVELMITLLVAGIVLSLAVPPFNGLMDRRQLETATSETINALKNARERAVGREEVVDIEQRAKSLTCNHDSATNDDPCDGYNIGYDAVSITADHDFSFDERGLLENANPGPGVLTLTLSHEDVATHNFEIRILGSGRISVRQVDI